jgi:transcriptional regulator with XRE-family HTH domain
LVPNTRKLTTLEEGLMSYRVADARRRSGLTQQEAADALGVTLQGYQYYEYGKRDMKSSVVRKLCEVFGCSAAYLLGMDETPTAPAPTSDSTLARLVANYTSMTSEGRAALVATSAALAAQFPQVTSGVSAEKSA